MLTCFARNTTNPDNSGNLKFLAEELQAAEDAGERVWILGHVLSGWDGTNPVPNPTGESCGPGPLNSSGIY